MLKADRLLPYNIFAIKMLSLFAEEGDGAVQLRKFYKRTDLRNCSMWIGSVSIFMFRFIILKIRIQQGSHRL